MALIELPMSLLDTDPNIQSLGVSALLKGARPTYRGDIVIYPIDDVYLEPTSASYIVGSGGVIKDYFITRYYAVSDLSEALPASFPGATTFVDDVEVPLTWADVQAYPTVSVAPVDGVYHFNCTAHLQHRGLTLDEHNAIVADGVSLVVVPPLPVVDEPA